MAHTTRPLQHPPECRGSETSVPKPAWLALNQGPFTLQLSVLLFPCLQNRYKYVTSPSHRGENMRSTWSPYCHLARVCSIAAVTHHGQGQGQSQLQKLAVSVLSQPWQIRRRTPQAKALSSRSLGAFGSAPGQRCVSHTSPAHFASSPNTQKGSWPGLGSWGPKDTQGALGVWGHFLKRRLKSSRSGKFSGGRD